MSDLKEKGVVKQILPIETGTSKAGKDWQKQEFVIETLDSQYPKKIAFTLFGDKTKLLESITEGLTVEVSFNLESREHNGRWFHNVNCWRIQPEESEQSDLPIVDDETIDDGRPPF